MWKGCGFDIEWLSDTAFFPPSTVIVGISTKTRICMHLCVCVSLILNNFILSQMHT